MFGSLVVATRRNSISVPNGGKLGAKNWSKESTPLAVISTVETTVLPGIGKLEKQPVGEFVPKKRLGS